MKILLYVFLGIVGVLVVYVAVLAVSAVIVKNREYEKDSAYYRFLLYGSTACFIKAARIKLHITGMEKLPEQGRFLLVCNHRSNFDPILTWYVFRKYKLAFISKAENFKIPMFGKIIRKCCFMAIDRENPRNALVTVKHAADLIINDTVSVAVYPEGTRSKTCVLLPFHNSVFKIATLSGAPIAVITIRGTENIHKNCPFKRSDVYLDVVDVIDSETVKANRTNKLGDRVRTDMLNKLGEEVAL